MFSPLEKVLDCLPGSRACVVGYSWQEPDFNGIIEISQEWPVY